MDKYPIKRYPIVGACGLDWGLCPRYHTEGISRCPGCCAPDFWQKHPGCGFITCCVRRRNLETCAQCVDRSGCEKVAKLLNTTKDSFISYKPLTANYAFIQEKSIEEFARLEMEKQRFLKYLLENYDEGRSKSFYCTSCQLIPLDKLKDTLADADARISEDNDIKERAKIVREVISNLADTLQVDLKLRK